MSAPIVVDLFCGAGGLSLGLRDAGFNPVFAADNDEKSLETYRRNLGNHALHLDLSSVRSDELARLIRDSIRHDPDVVCGGPPCQGFSIQRRGTSDDIRNGLYARFAEIAVSLNPRAIIIENVPTVFGKKGGAEVREAFRTLADAGYSVHQGILQAADYGVPQYRRRAFIIALSAAINSAALQWPPPKTSATAYITVRDAIGDLPEPPADFSEHPRFANHVRVRISEMNLRRIRHVPEGGGRLDVPIELQLKCHRSDSGHRHLDVYGRLRMDAPSGTITAMFDNFTRGRFAHPAADRNITGREGARLQTFPDDFVFFGDKKSVARQIGNAVPPKLATAVGLSLINVLCKTPADQHLRNNRIEDDRMSASHVFGRDANREELGTAAAHRPEIR
jgi:DNA (cytosine-5)-methyltransferase 1